MSHVLVLVTRHADGSMRSSHPWHRGTVEDCERVRSMVPAVSTSDSSIVEAQLVVMRASLLPGEDKS